jgi:hypothetical protein
METLQKENTLIPAILPVLSIWSQDFGKVFKSLLHRCHIDIAIFIYVTTYVMAPLHGYYILPGLRTSTRKKNYDVKIHSLTC